MKHFIIFSHVGAGVLVLGLGLVIMFLPKGTDRHLKLGKTYAAAMFWICISAFLLLFLYRFSMFLMVIAVLTFHATYSGIRVSRRRKTGEARWYDWLVSIATGLFGLGLMGYGGWVFWQVGNVHWVGILSVIFGGSTLASGFQDVRFYRNPRVEDRRWWLYQHINAMGGSYIAAVTAFAVQNANHFVPENPVPWLFWVLPGAIGGPIISMVIRRKKQKTSGELATAR